MLPLPLSSHDWIRRFVEQIHRVRPELAIGDLLQVAVAVHAVASAFMPEQVAVSAVRGALSAASPQGMRRS